MPKPIKKRVQKRAKAEEGVKDVFFGAKEFISEKQKTFFAVIVGAIIVSVAAAAFFIYRFNTENKARTLEYQGYKTYYGLYQKQPLQKGEQYQKALEEFSKAYDLRKSPYALYYMANCLYDMGRYNEALKDLKELNTRFPDDESFFAFSHYKMAAISLKQGNKEEALKLLDALYQRRTAPLRDLALVESARILESMGKTGESSQKYAELIKTFPGSMLAAEAQAKNKPKKESPAKR
jgi:tetratricopeptide (TPR) repeat protein